MITFSVIELNLRKINSLHQNIGTYHSGLVAMVDFVIHYFNHLDIACQYSSSVFHLAKTDPDGSGFV